MTSHVQALGRAASSRRGLLALGAALLLAGPLPASADPARDAAGFIQALGDSTVDVLRQSGSNQARRTQGLIRILDRAVDVDLIARLVLGRHWREASEAQRGEYLKLFRAYALDSLARRFSGYTGSERFTIQGSRPATEEDTMVSTLIELSDERPPIRVEWRVRQTEGRPMIIDVVAEGVSLLVTNRDQFGAVASQRGIDGLLRDMRSRAAG